MTYNKFLLEQSILVFTLNNGPFLNLNDSPSTNISHIPQFDQSKFPFYKFPINATEQHRVIKEAEFIKKYKPKLNK